MPSDILALVDKYGWLAGFCLLFVSLYLRELERGRALQRELFELGKASVEASLRTAEALRALLPK